MKENYVGAVVRRSAQIFLVQNLPDWGVPFPSYSWTAPWAKREPWEHVHASAIWALASFCFKGEIEHQSVFTYRRVPTDGHELVVEFVEARPSDDWHPYLEHHRNAVGAGWFPYDVARKLPLNDATRDCLTWLSQNGF
mgnify:CR=1 FL=1